jgi:hypothetical protein
MAVAIRLDRRHHTTTGGGLVYTLQIMAQGAEVDTNLATTH